MHRMDDRFLAAVSRFEPNGHRKLGHFSALSDFPEESRVFLAREEEADRKRHVRTVALRQLRRVVSGSFKAVFGFFVGIARHVG